MGGVTPSLYFFNMAKKTIFQDIDYTAIDDLNILDTREFGTYINSGAVKTLLHTESSASFERVEALLTESSGSKVQSFSGKKVFVLPSCNVKGDRVKSALREHKLVVTNDYELADLIITHDNVTCHSDDTVRTTSLMQKMNNKYLINESPTQDYYEDTGNYTIWDSKLDVGHNMYNFVTTSAPYTLRLISGLAINLAKLIQDKTVDIIHVDDVLYSSGNVQILTETLMEDLTRMMNGSEDDYKLAATIIPTISPKSDPIMLWNFCKSNEQNFSYRYRNEKDIKYWMNLIDYTSLVCMEAEAYIAYLIRRDAMTTEAFKQLEPICRKDIYISNRELYNFTVQLKPEYQQYLKKEA